MPMYLVSWQIDIDAETPEEAAAIALIIQRDNDPANTATVFDVAHPSLANGSVRIDLSADADDGEIDDEAGY